MLPCDAHLVEVSSGESVTSNIGTELEANLSAGSGGWPVGRSVHPERLSKGLISSYRLMNKRTFLNLVSSGILSRAVTPFSMALAGDKLSNWSGNLIYGTNRVTEATSIEQIRSFVK
jgi:hypothetical protein